MILIISNAPKNIGLPYFYYLALKESIGSKEEVKYLYSQNKEYVPPVHIRIYNRFKSLIHNNSLIVTQSVLEVLKDQQNVKLFLFNSSGISPEHLGLIKQKIKGVIINYISDSPFGMDPIKFRNVTQSLPLIDLTVAYSDLLKPVLYQYGAKEVITVPFGFCKFNHYRAFSENFIDNHSVFYFGTWGKQIEEWLFCLKDFNLFIEGHYWEKSKYSFLRKAAKKSPGQATQSEMSSTANNAAVVVNFIRAEHGCYNSMKTFELPAASTCVVTNNTKDQNDFFDANAFAYFDNKTQMVKNISDILSDSSINASYRKAAQEQVKKHSYSSRAIDILEKL